MTIAQRTDYIQTNEEGIIDLKRTIEELKRFRNYSFILIFFDQYASCYLHFTCSIIAMVSTIVFHGFERSRNSDLSAEFDFYLISLLKSVYRLESQKAETRVKYFKGDQLRNLRYNLGQDVR